MEQQDLTCEEFRCSVFDYLEGDISSSKGELYELHERDCAECRTLRSDSIKTLELLQAHGEEVVPTDRMSSLLEAFGGWFQGDSVESDLGRVADQERTLLELEQHDGVRRRVLIKNCRRFRNPELCRHFIDQSWEHRGQDPETYLELARTAVDISESLEQGQLPEDEVNDLRSLALANLGNAERVASDPRGAEKTLRKAWTLSQEGTNDPGICGRILRFQAHVLVVLGRWEEAALMFDRALLKLRLADDPHLVGWTMIDYGVQRLQEGDPEGALTLITHGLAKVDLERAPRLLLVAKHAYVHCLMETGKASEASQLLPELRKLHGEFAEDLSLLRLKWLEGKVRIKLGSSEEAETLFWKVREGFTRKQCPLEVALVTLDLSMIYVGQSRHQELKQLAAEMIVLFRSRGVHREAIAALSLFQRAVEMERLSLGFIKELAEYLNKARLNPKLQFRDGAGAKQQIH